MISQEIKPDWEALYREAQLALERTLEALDDITGWSGGSGNWTAHDASTKVRKALEILADSK